MNPLGLTGEEKRADRRYKVSFRVNLMREESPEVEGEVTNLSVGRCFVESELDVREGDLVKLRLNVPSRGELTIWGSVVFRVRHVGFGVRFSAFSQGGRPPRPPSLSQTSAAFVWPTPPKRWRRSVGRRDQHQPVVGLRISRPRMPFNGCCLCHLLTCD